MSWMIMCWIEAWEKIWIHVKPRSFHLFQCCSNFVDPDAIYWSFLNSSQYSMIAFIFFIHQFSMYSFHKSLIPFLFTILLSDSLIPLYRVLLLPSALLFGTRRTRVDICVNANMELIDKFCYLGDMLSVDRDADAAVRPEFEFNGISSGSWYHCLPIKIYHWQWDEDCTAIVCEVVCCMEVRPGS